MTPLALEIVRSGRDALRLELTGSADIALVESAASLGVAGWQPVATVSVGEPYVLPFSSTAGAVFYRARTVR